MHHGAWPSIHIVFPYILVCFKTACLQTKLAGEPYIEGQCVAVVVDGAAAWASPTTQLPPASVLQELRPFHMGQCTSGEWPSHVGIPTLPGRCLARAVPAVWRRHIAMGEVFSDAAVATRNAFMRTDVPASDLHVQQYPEECFPVALLPSMTHLCV